MNYEINLENVFLSVIDERGGGAARLLLESLSEKVIACFWTWKGWAKGIRRTVVREIEQREMWVAVLSVGCLDRRCVSIQKCEQHNAVVPGPVFDSVGGDEGVVAARLCLPVLPFPPISEGPLRSTMKSPATGASRRSIGDLVVKKGSPAFFRCQSPFRMNGGEIGVFKENLVGF
jgi:hypothetical protein